MGCFLISYSMKKYFVVLLALTVISSSPAWASGVYAFSLKGDDGRIHRLADYGDKTLVLFFFSFQCLFCQMSFNSIEGVYREAPRDVALMGVVFNSTDAELRERKKASRLTFPVLFGNPDMVKAYGAPGTPFAAIISKKGFFAERLYSASEISHLKATVEGLDKGDVGVFELAENGGVYVGKEVSLSGTLMPGPSAYFPKPVFRLSNGIDSVLVTPWLPVETVRPLPEVKGKPMVMSRLLNKFVTVRGRVFKTDKGIAVKVSEAMYPGMSPQHPRNTP